MNKTLTILTALFAAAALCPAASAQGLEGLAGDGSPVFQQQSGLEPLRLTAPETPKLVPDFSAAPIGNMGLVSPGIYRGQRLTRDEEYRFLRQELGVDVVLNLEHFAIENQELCRKNSLRCAELPLLLFVGADLVFDWQTFRNALRFVLQQRGEGRKVYFHCLHGSDRTGALAAAIMIRERACGTVPDKDALWDEISATLDQHGFHTRYVFLRRSIKSWVFEFEKNPWLCE
jgi:protein-tyrosine phosphatase